MSTSKQLFGVVVEAQGKDSVHETEVEAKDFEEAAEKAIEEYDEYDADYPLAGKGEARKVRVTDINRISKRFKMTGYFTTIYEAEEIGDEQGNQSDDG